MLDRLSTARLTAERLSSEHSSELRRMFGDPVVMAHLGGVRDEAYAAQYLARNLQHWEEHGFGVWIVRERADGPPIGRAVLRYLSLGGVDEVEVGYAFYADYWGRGYASEVTRRCLDVARCDLGLASVVALTGLDNAASHRVLTKAGLTFERECSLHGTLWALFRVRWERLPPDATSDCRAADRTLRVPSCAGACPHERPGGVT